LVLLLIKKVCTCVGDLLVNFIPLLSSWFSKHWKNQARIFQCLEKNSKP